MRVIGKKCKVELGVDCRCMVGMKRSGLGEVEMVEHEDEVEEEEEDEMIEHESPSEVDLPDFVEDITSSPPQSPTNVITNTDEGYYSDHSRPTSPLTSACQEAFNGRLEPPDASLYDVEEDVEYSPSAVGKVVEAASSSWVSVGSVSWMAAVVVGASVSVANSQ